MTQCLNCRTSLDGIFCPNCGQKDVDLERPAHQLVGEVLRESFDLDGRAFRTIRALFEQPGHLTSEFLAGRRSSYTSPIRLYLLISVAFFVLIAWLAGEGVLLMPEAGLEIDATSQAQFMSDQLPRVMFVLLPVFALLLKIVSPGRLLFDHAIFSIHLHCAAYVTLAFSLPLEEIADEHWLPLLAQGLLFVYLLGYFVISMHRVYHASWIVATAKSMAIFVAYLVIFVVVVVVTGDLQLPDVGRT